MRYRNCPGKEQFSGKIPADLATLVREKIARERRTISEVMAESLCRTVGVDPKTYGIETAPRKRRRREQAEPAAV